MFEIVGRWLRAYAEKDGRGYPDWAMRYVPVVARLRRRGLEGARVFELGANESGLTRFVVTRVIAVNLDLDHLRAARRAGNVLPVQADLRALPFRPGSADVCVCMDTFEHLPSDSRHKAAEEIVRVLRDAGTAAVAFPAGDEALRAEQAIQAAYRAYTGNSLAWLDEHAGQGLPDPARIMGYFEVAAAGRFRVTRSKNTPLGLWRWLWRVLMCGWPGRGNAVFQALLRVATPVLCRVHWGKCYRTVVWIEGRSK